eukprot:TRINITY_DN29485_c0_g1_i1.p1 TRINITY_DN29485_c0_g1~~TRINITY_DN29485_c0_g1_i1.p1  ORF type:complete len:305 (+),score=50.89 TRINITY_DN29485_c0_g1_i1:613-1527(+)
MSSFMSHSCYPNAVWHYDEDDFVLRARSDIEAGDEVTVSYLSEESLLESTASRRKHLKDSKHFLCDCPRCTAFADPCSAFRCPDCSKISAVFGYVTSDKVPGMTTDDKSHCKCEHCGKRLSSGEVAMLKSEEKLLESKLVSIYRGIEQNGAKSKHTELLHQLERDLQRAEKSLAQHWLLAKAWEMATDLAIRNDLLEDAETMMRKRLDFQAKSYPGISGTNAWTLEAYADMLLQHSRCTCSKDGINVPSKEAAQKLLPKVPSVYAASLRILRLMFGEDHEYYLAVNRKAMRLQDELQRHLGPLR